jgi:hypothetical protein
MYSMVPPLHKHHDGQSTSAMQKQSQASAVSLLCPRFCFSMHDLLQVFRKIVVHDYVTRVQLAALRGER